MRFVILAAARSGSTYLTSYLSLHKDIWCHDEVFNPAKTVFSTAAPAGAECRGLSAELLRLRAEDPFSFLETIYGIGHGREHVGFKLFPSHSPDVLDNLIADREVRKVLLFRSNLLARHASNLAASETRTRGQVPERPLVRFVPADFIRQSRRYQRFFRRTIATLQERGQSYFFLRSDELMFEPKLHQLLGFLGASGPLPQWDQGNPWVRGSSDIVSRFSNPDELAAFLQARGLMHLAWESDLTLETAPIARSFPIP